MTTTAQCMLLNTDAYASTKSGIIYALDVKHGHNAILLETKEAFPS